MNNNIEMVYKKLKGIIDDLDVKIICAKAPEFKVKKITATHDIIFIDPITIFPDKV